MSAPEPRWLTADEQTAWRSFLRGMWTLMAHLDDDLQPHGISMSEYEILAVVSEQPTTTIRMSTLADLVVQSRSRLTHAAKRLEQRGWVYRVRSTRDGRGVELGLTDTGRATLDRFAPLHLASVRARVVELLSHDEFAELGRIMAAVRDGEPTPARLDEEDGAPI